MANQLKMAQRQSILTLARLGWSYRRIAAELGLDRDTVSRHVKAAVVDGDPASAHGPQPPEPNAAISIIGSGDDVVAAAAAEAPVLPSMSNSGANAAMVITGSAADLPEANAAISIAGSTPPDTLPQGTALPSAGGLSGRQSHCEPWRAIILQSLERGLTARRVWQDLKAEHAFTGDYQSVQRFVRRLREATPPLPFRRMECEPGEEAQVDFGKGAPVVTADGKRSRPHLFRIVLSCSRKAYSEVVPRQTTEHFLRALENAFCRFGGVPRTLVIDNLKAAVTRDGTSDHLRSTKLPVAYRVPRDPTWSTQTGNVSEPCEFNSKTRSGLAERGLRRASSRRETESTMCALSPSESPPNRETEPRRAGSSTARTRCSSLSPGVVSSVESSHTTSSMNGRRRESPVRSCW